MKKIVFFSKNLKIGGMEKALVALLNSLSDKYFITLVLEEKSGILLKDLNEKIVVEEYALCKSKIVILRKLVNFFKRFLWKVKNSNRYDFSCNYATYSVIGSRLAQISSKNSAFYIHSNYYDMFHGDKTKILNFFEPHRLYNFKHVIFVSNESKDKLISVYPSISSKTIVINNLLLYNDIRNLSKENVSLRMNKDDINLVFIGRLENESKNFDLLIDSFNAVVKKKKNFMLYIIGDGNYYNRIKGKISLLNLKYNVFLLGEKENPYPYLKMCDAIIFTSNYEGFPVTYMEALVLGKKILTTVVVSDEILDMHDYVIELEREPLKIAEKIMRNVSKESHVKIDVDFEELNKKRLRELEKLIEVERWKK